MQELDCRRYRIDRRSDVQIAAVSLQRKDYYPDLNEVDRAALGTIIAELGSNILKYGVAGTIRISRVQEGDQNGILILAEDRGPGIPDVERSLEDHYSTGNTLGLGLPAVRRMSDELAIDTTIGQGTKVRALRWIRQRSPARRPWPVAPAGEARRSDPHPAGLNRSDRGVAGRGPSDRLRTDATQAAERASGAREPDQPLQEGGFQLCLESRIRPCYPERLSGDQLLALRKDDLWFQALVDGCGHGPEAHTAACGIIAAMEGRFQQLVAEHGTGSPLMAEQWLTALLRAAHEQARHSRGGAIGLSLIDGRHRTLWFSGIGNTRILQFKPRGWTGVSRDGQLGDRFPTPFVQCFPLEPADTVVQCSDGLRESEVRALRQSLEPKSSPAALADQLLNIGSRRDDVSVLVMRCQP